MQKLNVSWVAEPWAGPRLGAVVAVLVVLVAPITAVAQTVDARLLPEPLTLTWLSAEQAGSAVAGSSRFRRAVEADDDRCDPRWDGAVLGAATGVPLGHFGIDLVLVRRGDSCAEDCHTLSYILLGAALGAGSGWLLDAWHCVLS